MIVQSNLVKHLISKFLIFVKLVLNVNNLQIF